MELITEMDKIVKEVIERTEGLCEICYSQGEHRHHAVAGRGKRTQHQTQYSVYNLCHLCHDRIHNNRFEDLRLKFETQNRYENLNYKKEEIMRLMGDRLYTEIDVIRVFEKRNQEVNYCIVESVMNGLAR